MWLPPLNFVTLHCQYQFVPRADMAVHPYIPWFPYRCVHSKPGHLGPDYHLPLWQHSCYRCILLRRQRFHWVWLEHVRANLPPPRDYQHLSESLCSIDVKDLKTYQQLCIYFIPIISQLGFVNIVVVVVRLHWFRKRLQSIGELLCLIWLPFAISFPWY